MRRDNTNQTLAVWAVIIFLAGCGGNTGPAIAFVSGTVHLDETPLRDAMVSFYPQDGGRSSHGITDDSGRYELMYTGTRKGALVCEHLVRIETGVITGESMETSRKQTPKISAKYNSDSELTAQVNPGTNTYNFELKSEGK